MATDTEQLVVLLEARIRDFERNMAKANSTAQREFSAIERRGEQSAKRMQGVMTDMGSSIQNSIAGMGRNLLAGGLAALASEQTIRAIGRMVKAVADLADEAQRAGLAAEDFQSLVFAGHQAGVETEKLGNLMQIFNREIGEAQFKGGDLAKILAANGVSLSDANGKLRDTKTLFYSVVDLIKNAKTEQEKVLIATAAFGKAASDALPLLQQGADAIKASEKAAHDAGAIIDEKLVRRAAEFDDKWTAAIDTWSAKGKSAVLAVMSDLVDLIELADTFLEKIGSSTETARSTFADSLHINPMTASSMWFYDRYLSGDSYEPLIKKTDDLKSAEDDLSKLAKKRLDIEGQIADLKKADAAPIQIQEFEDRLDSVNNKLEEAQKRLNALRLNSGPSFESFGRGGSPMPATVVPDLGGAASDLKDASAGLKHATSGGMLDMIGYAEGTDKGRGYNETLGYGAFTGGPVNLVNMTLQQVMALQSQMLRNPANSFNSSAVGRYQITRTTLQGLINQLNLDPEQQFTPALQDRLASVLIARRGHNPANLRNEWEGLRRISDGDINTAMGNSSSVVETGTKAINERKEALKRLLDSQRDENSSLRVEAQAMGMSVFDAARLRKEHELLAQAKHQGLPIDAALKASISTLATEYAKGQQAIEGVRQSQEKAAHSAEEMQMAQMRAAQASQEFGQLIAGVTKGFLHDLIAGKSATEALQNAVMNLATSLADRAIDSLFGSMFSGGGKGKAGGGLLSAFALAEGGRVGRDGRRIIRRFASGGHVSGPGTGTSDSIPAMLSDGEFVVKAEQAQKHQALLEAINSGAVLRFADGGKVGSTPARQLAASAQPITQPVAINTTVNVNATGGDAKQNDDLARRVAKEVEGHVRGLVYRELRQQQKPMGMLNSI